MKFIEIPLTGALVIDVEPAHDERGFFARTWCRDEFAERGLETAVAQNSISFNRRRATLRGLHYQAPPHDEVKLVRCTRGAIYDVIVDLRPDGETFGKWFGIELTAENHRMLYVPKGMAHGFVTLLDDTEIYYQISQPQVPQAARGIRWNDPHFNITWPVAPEVISERDRTYIDFDRNSG